MPVTACATPRTGISRTRNTSSRSPTSRRRWTTPRRSWTRFRRAPARPAQNNPPPLLPQPQLLLLLLPPRHSSSRTRKIEHRERTAHLKPFLCGVVALFFVLCVLRGSSLRTLRLKAFASSNALCERPARTQKLLAAKFAEKYRKEREESSARTIYLPLASRSRRICFT